jgi:tetratricopeptide (TPR) repeat protein
MRVKRDAAKLLLRTLNDPAALRENVLLADFSACSHDERRAAVLRALDQLDPGVLAGLQADRRRRKHAILLRCDVYGEAQDLVAQDLGLSMRQFFRERGEAFEEFIGTLQAKPPAPRAQVPLSDVFAVRERFIQKLRGCGQHERVWAEASAFASELGESERAIEFWSVAAEGACYMGELDRSAEAIAMAQRVREVGNIGRPVSADILIAIPQIALDWTRGRYVDAADRLQTAIRRYGYGRALVDLDATLFGIMLTYGVPIEIERGRWEQARTLLRHLEDIGGRIDKQHTFPSLRRHAGRVALRGQRDDDRAIVELREALAVAQRFDNFAAEASAATDLGIALAARDPAAAGEYITYGLAAGRRILGRNEFAMLALGALPAICLCFGIGEASARLEELAICGPLADRARFAFDLAEIALMFARREYRAVLERAQPLAQTLERRGLVAPAGEAMLIAASAHAANGRHSVARKLLCECTEVVRACGETAAGWSGVFGSNLAVARH